MRGEIAFDGGFSTCNTKLDLFVWSAVVGAGVARATNVYAAVHEHGPTVQRCLQQRANYDARWHGSTPAHESTPNARSPSRTTSDTGTPLRAA